MEMRKKIEDFPVWILAFLSFVAREIETGCARVFRANLGVPQRSTMFLQSGRKRLTFVDIKLICSSFHPDMSNLGT